jgi:hypothetical protein
MLDKDAVTYSETLEDMGVMVRKLQEMLDPYDGSVRLCGAPEVTHDGTRQDKSGYNAIHWVSVQMSVSYDPQTFRQDIRLSPPQGERTRQGE